MEIFVESIKGLIADSGFINLQWQNLVMIGISCVLMFLAIKKGFEPLLLLPIAFGMLLTNLPCPEKFQVFHMEFFSVEHVDYGNVIQNGSY